MSCAAMLLDFLNMTGDVGAEEASQAVISGRLKKGDWLGGGFWELKDDQVRLMTYDVANLLSRFDDALPFLA